MFHWSDIFKGTLTLRAQAFGKLPFYRDYLRWVSSEAAESWRMWLVEKFSGDAALPPGKWPFIFQHHPGSALVIGLIEPGTDGIREFPFSLFVAADRALLKSRYFGGCVISIWHSLALIRDQIARHNDIDRFNRFIREQTVVVKKRESGPENRLHDAQMLLKTTDRSEPVLMVFRNPDGEPGVILGCDCFNTKFSENWGALKNSHD